MKPEDTRDAPLNPVERLAVEFELTGHQDDADAVILLDYIFSRICSEKPENLTKCGKELQDKMIEAIGFWLPDGLVISDGSGIHPAKHPMDGGFSLDKFMPGLLPEDAAAFATALESADMSGEPCPGCVKLGAAFDDQSRVLEIACDLMTPEQLTEYRHRAYPTLYPR